jgi:hypothetical protein
MASPLLGLGVLAAVAVAGAAAGIETLAPGGRPVRRLVAGVVVATALLAVFVLALFLPYWMEWGDRRLSGFGREFGWRETLSWMLLMALATGAVLGAVVAAVVPVWPRR